MPSFGFASNLSHSVIREHDDEVRSVDSVMSSDTQDEMTDDQMALLGPPWAKEGILQTRQYWESMGKKAKKQDWKQHFVVVQKGELLMFTFGSGKGGAASGTFGGGNWTVRIYHPEGGCEAYLTGERQCRWTTLAHARRR